MTSWVVAVNMISLVTVVYFEPEDRMCLATVLTCSQGGTEKKHCFGPPWEPSLGLLCVSRGGELYGAENLPLPLVSL